MRLRLTVLPNAGPPRPVTLAAAPTDTVADLRPLLVEAKLANADSHLSVGERPLAGGDLLGMPPLVDGAVLRIADRPPQGAGARGRAPSGSPAGSTGPLRLEVVGGPDAGGVLTLGPGRHRFGRGADLELTVADPHLSRRHGHLEVTAAGLHVGDGDSTNGIRRIGPTGDSDPIDDTTTLTVGDRLRAGSTTFAIRGTADRAAPLHPLGNGTIEVRRTASPPTGWRPARLSAPAPPEEERRARFPWVQVLLPLPICGVLALLWGPQLLAFALLGPLMAGGTAISDRFGRRRRAREEAAEFATASAAHSRAVHEAVAGERRHRLHTHPDPATILAAATGPTVRLWERGPHDPASLALRLGLGDVTGVGSVSGADPTGDADLLLPECPVVLDLAAVGSVGLDGSAESVERGARWLVAQLATLVPPDALRIAVVGDDPAWAWLGLLPHAVPAEDLLTDAHADGVGAGEGARGVVGVVLVPTPSLVAELSGLSEAIGRRDGRVHVIALDAHGLGLPAGLGARIGLGPDGGIVHVIGAPDGPHIFLPDGLGQSRAERLGHALAPLRPAGRDGRGDLPGRVALLDVNGTADAESVVAQWDRRGGPTAVVGVDPDGPLTLDLRRDGPHVLVGGTTGAGKSELLRALVGGLCLGSSPSDLGLVLIDYKGGAAFGDLVGMPHVAALVTDLDAGLVDRALTSLRAELSRREHVLTATGSADLDEHLRRGGERLPRLVIVVDELRALVEELPGFVHGLVRVASLGRSLGVHLVLATQRPAGVVTADIAANINLRIALRVRDRADSESIIGTPEAAALPPSAPGRAIASLAGHRVTFQSALVAPSDIAAPPLRLVTADLEVAGPARPRPEDQDVTLTELAVEAARVAGHRRAVAPWQPPLPRDLPWTAHPDGEMLALGMLDDPEHQRVDSLGWSPTREGGLVLLGGPRAGRTTALRTAIHAALAAPDPWQVQILQSGSDLADLRGRPGIGTVASLHDSDLVGRFVDRLAAEVATRRTGGGAGARLLVVVDGWDALAPAATDLAAAELTERFLGVLREGSSVGIHCIAAGGRALTQGRAAELFLRRIVLGRLDATTLLLVGARADRAASTNADSPPPAGRGLDLRSGLEIQIALPPAPSAAAPREVVPIEGVAPFVVAPLPARVEQAHLHGLGAIGLDADGAEVGFAAEDSLVLVVGQRGSGRSTALQALASAWRAEGLRTVLLDEASEATVREVRERLSSDPDLCVLVDDIDRHSGTALETLVTDLVTSASAHRHRIAVAADSHVLLRTFRGPALAVAARGTGILLGPAASAEGDLLGIRARPARERAPGRGLLVRGGRSRLVQIAVPEPQPEDECRSLDAAAMLERIEPTAMRSREVPIADRPA